MTTIHELINKYTEKTLRASEDYSMIVRHKEELYYCRDGRRDTVLSAYIAMDFGEGMVPYETYDMYVEDKPAPVIRLLWHAEDKLICYRYTEEEAHRCQIIGFDDKKLAEFEDAEIIHQAQRVFAYIRSKHFHLFLFADLEHGSIRVIEQLAQVDEKSQAVPDAITSVMAAFFHNSEDSTDITEGAVKIEITESEAENHD